MRKKEGSAERAGALSPGAFYNDTKYLPRGYYISQAGRRSDVYPDYGPTYAIYATARATHLMNDPHAHAHLRQIYFTLQPFPAEIYTPRLKKSSYLIVLTKLTVCICPGYSLAHAFSLRQRHVYLCVCLIIISSNLKLCPPRSRMCMREACLSSSERHVKKFLIS